MNLKRHRAEQINECPWRPIFITGLIIREVLVNTVPSEERRDSLNDQLE